MQTTLSYLKSRLELLPVLSHGLRRLRKLFFPNEHDRWQIGSDMFAAFLLQTTRSVAQPIFVKVGANDGITGDPCGRIFLDNKNWSGVLIEPVPYLARRLAENYCDGNRFVVEQLAIGRTRGSSQFYCVDVCAKQYLPDLPSNYDMLGSFNKHHVEKHLDGILAPFILAVDTEVQTLADVLERNGIDRIDVLQIDTEGFNWDVLHSLDFSKVRPMAICI